jgi:hypothetical protein
MYEVHVHVVPSINDSDTSSLHWVGVPHSEVAIQTSRHHQTSIHTQTVYILRGERKKDTWYVTSIAN